MANSTANRRRALFYHFSKNLHLLKDNGYLPDLNLDYEKTFICPICLGQFSKMDLNSKSANMLTVEHAPPESLGGNGNTLTCKQCNSIAGNEIDSHLLGRLRELDIQTFSPNTESRAKITSGNITVQGRITVGENGVMKMTHDIRHNNPSILNEFIDRVGPDTNSLIHIEFANKNNKTDLGRWQVALLKSAYLLVFERFGYAFILDGVVVV